MFKPSRRVTACALALLLWIGSGLVPSDSARADEASAPLDIEGALRIAIQNNPELEALRVEVEAREWELRQAGRTPNPALEAEVDGFAGSGDLAALDDAGFTMLWAQPFALGGRIDAQRELAGFERSLAEWDEAQGRVDLLADIHLAFLGVLAGQELVTIEREVLGVAERILGDLDRRVQAGASSPAELHRAKVSSASARLELLRAEAALQQSRQVLGARMGLEQLEHGSVTGEIFLSSELPDLDELLIRAKKAPLLARYEDEQRAWDARSRLARAQSHGELDVNAGLKHERSTADWGLVLQIAMPLRLSDTGDDGAQAATLRGERSRLESRAVRIRQVEAIRQSFTDLQRSQTELDVLGGEIIPEARKAFERTREAFDKGRSSLTDLLDAQRVLFDLSRQRVVVALEHHRAYARLQALVALDPHDLDLHHESEQS